MLWRLNVYLSSNQRSVIQKSFSSGGLCLLNVCICSICFTVFQQILMDNIGELEDDAPQPNLSEDGRFVILDQPQNLPMSHEQIKSANLDGSESEAWSFDLHQLWACLQIMCRIHRNNNQLMCFFLSAFCGLLIWIYKCQGSNIFAIPKFTILRLFSSAGNIIAMGIEGMFWYSHYVKEQDVFETFYLFVQHMLSLYKYHT